VSAAAMAATFADHLAFFVPAIAHRNSPKHARLPGELLETAAHATTVGLRAAPRSGLPLYPSQRSRTRSGHCRLTRLIRPTVSECAGSC
jgi:hypothetical protein